jgi:hypothetical protein
MSQTTGTGGGSGTGPKKPTNPQKQPPTIDARKLVAEEDPTEDLGLSEEEEAFIPDPTGFDPKGPVHNIGGRDMIKLSREDLSNLHHAHAGNAPMVPDPTKHLSDRPLPDPETLRERDLRGNPDARQRAAQQAAQTDDLASEVLGGFTPSQDQPVTGAPTTPPPGTPVTTTPKTTPVVDGADNPEETVEVLEAILIRAQKARDEGDVRLSNELNVMAQRIVEGTSMQRVQPKKERHPTAQKLLEAFGLEKIESKEIEWMGFKWKFQPRPPAMDLWITTHSGTNNMDLNAAIIASTVVALDGDPVWKVFNIPLTANYKVEGPQLFEGVEPAEGMVDIPVYRKFCESCRCEVRIEDEKCPTCTAALDPFDVPIELRFKYADTLFRFITEKLGLDFADLQALVNLYREAMKDRMFDKEELYPLLRLSKTQEEKTPG